MSKDSYGEIKDWFIKRTKKHIDLVKKYADLIMNEFEGFDELRGRMKTHDQSKFEEPELDPYIYTTWKYKCKDSGEDFNECNPPDDIEEKMKQATLHHIFNNSHHPEYHLPKGEQTEDVLNAGDRDKPGDTLVNATAMPNIDIAEMVADWCGVSEERGTDPNEWARMNIGKRWKFSDVQTDLIYEIISKIWENDDE